MSAPDHIRFPNAGLGLGSPAAPDDDLDPMTARVVRGNPTDDELAAVVAVIAAVFDAGQNVDRPRDLAARPTGWARSQRSLRLPPGAGSSEPFGMRFGR